MGHLGGLVLLVGRLIYLHVWGKTLELVVHAYEIRELLMLKVDFCSCRDSLFALVQTGCQCESMWGTASSIVTCNVFPISDELNV